MKLNKIMSFILATASTVALAGGLSACETNTPEVEIKISFNEKSYTLNYELNRKITPKTVEHFLTLAEKKYYDGFCVHNYSTSKMYTGAYKWENEQLVYQNYYDTVKSYIPKSVWQDEAKTIPTYTLYGEFEENKFEVASGSLKESFGSLVMYYSDKGEDVSVSISKNDGSGTASRNYTQNSATSQFYISLSSTSAVNKSYCVFATLDSDSVSTLKSLQNAIADYIEDEYGTESDSAAQFTTDTEITIDEDDTVLTDYEDDVTFAVPNKEIKIVSVRVIKY